MSLFLVWYWHLSKWLAESFIFFRSVWLRHLSYCYGIGLHRQSTVVIVRPRDIWGKCNYPPYLQILLCFGLINITLPVWRTVFKKPVFNMQHVCFQHLSYNINWCYVAVWEFDKVYWLCYMLTCYCNCYIYTVILPVDLYSAFRLLATLLIEGVFCCASIWGWGSVIRMEISWPKKNDLEH